MKDNQTDSPIFLEQISPACFPHNDGLNLVQLIQAEGFQQLETAVALSQKKADCSSDDIHDIRLVIKHLRAYLRLLRYSMSKVDFKQSDSRLKLIGKQLSGQRDQSVLIDSIHSLFLELPKGNQALYASLLKGAGSSVLEHENQIDWGCVVSNFARELESWKRLTDVSLKSIKKGLKRTQKRSQPPKKISTDRLKRINQRHEWRKWVKHYLYQMKLLKKTNCLNKAFIKKQIASIDRLGEYLGQEHDYELLQDFLLSQIEHLPLFQYQINELIDPNQQRIDRLQNKALMIDSS